MSPTLTNKRLKTSWPYVLRSDPGTWGCACRYAAKRGRIHAQRGAAPTDCPHAPDGPRRRRLAALANLAQWRDTHCRGASPARSSPSNRDVIHAEDF